MSDSDELGHHFTDDFNRSELGEGWTQTYALSGSGAISRMPLPASCVRWVTQEWVDGDGFRMTQLVTRHVRYVGSATDPTAELLEHAKRLGAQEGDSIVGIFRRDGDTVRLDPDTVELKRAEPNRPGFGARSEFPTTPPDIRAWETDLDDV